MRAKGIEREIRARLPWGARKCVKAEAGQILLSMPDNETDEFRSVSAKVSEVLEGADALPVLPREIDRRHPRDIFPRPP